MAKIYLTALRISPQKQEDLAVPKVYSVETADIIKQTALIGDDGEEHTHLKVVKAGGRYSKNLKVAEKLGEVYLMEDFNNAASSPYNTGTKANNVSPSASTQAGAIAVTAYHNSISAAAAASNAIKLPNASGAGRLKTAMVVHNPTSVAIKVFPSASEFLDGSSTAAVTVDAGRFRHFYCSASDKWVTAKGPYY